ncbi:uncharacterized protein ATNIH1004_009240 [Aspergillus tanneri]|uniref:Uncharacterized protein n=1 Tax=Aspergillus tanneri TaxID=1220188 RepID=A0A5M9MKT6_9EURO|nr:uncharacterized protein ATNIH1004_009240 [Aspergillus tanneri]KAA8645029.1 hypothetical protein ATNIH1004_009240 [Aspergillus tanneri]
MIPGELEENDTNTANQEPEVIVQKVRSKSGNISYMPSSKSIVEDLTPGLSNEDLWMLIRRFNKQIYYVKATHETTQQDLDLNRAEDEQFPPEKLRMTLERFYTSVIVGFTNLSSHIVMVRSWKEPRRTSVFCAVDSTEDNVNDQPRGSDRITGASEKYKGEAVEQEASNLVNSIANVAMESAAGKYGQSIKEGTTESPPDPEDTLDEAMSADAPDHGVLHDKAKKPMRKKVSAAADRSMRLISDITDVYERFANVLSPTPPFYAVRARLRLIGLLLCVSIASRFILSHVIVKSATFLFGLVIFGDPLFQQTIDYLNRNHPNWKDYFNLQRSLLQDVPTNAQLTLTLLRIGELNSSPLPPPPSTSATKNTPLPTESPNQHPAQDINKPKQKWAVKVLRLLRRTISTAIKGHIAVDRAISIVNSTHTQSLVRMLRTKSWVSAQSGPLIFDAKFERRRGTVVIDSSGDPPVLYFTMCSSAMMDDLRVGSQKKGSVLFQLPVTDIRALKKTEGLGWKGKLIVELAVGSKGSG